MAEHARLPRGVESRRPTDARVCDYVLGGKDNYAVDRTYAEKMDAALPGIGRIVVENGRFTRRAVRTLLTLGTRQFLELGCGLPRRGNVHDVAGPESTVVYIDYDPVVVSHYQAVLCRNESADAIHADVTAPGRILRHPVVAEMIDFERPVAVLMTDVLPFITDDQNPAGIVRMMRERLAPGSHLVLTHATHEMMSPEALKAVLKVSGELREPIRLRGAAEIAALFDGFELLQPGLVDASDWRPDRPYLSRTSWLLAGVGRKP